MKTPTISEIQALNGKIFAMLSAREKEVLDYYRDQGRKHGVAVSIVNEADPEELARAVSKEQADQIMQRGNSRVSVTVAAGHLQQLLADTPQHRQRQDGTDSQQRDVEAFLLGKGVTVLGARDKVHVATRLGCYDAADLYKIQAAAQTNKENAR
ncbi:hypothetical protein [Duganella vulcania]|uniref:hypothetical protein n=1 Tax=Duganella vulcania TaxID=2692166 RepID=UPI001583DE45|nr:hypothetical protein [Duganella vulcania]